MITLRGFHFTKKRDIINSLSVLLDSVSLKKEVRKNEIKGKGFYTTTWKGQIVSIGKENIKRFSIQYSFPDEIVIFC